MTKMDSSHITETDLESRRDEIADKLTALRMSPDAAEAVREAEGCGSPKLNGSVGNGGVSGKGSKRDPPSARRGSYTITTT